MVSGKAHYLVTCQRDEVIAWPVYVAGDRDAAECRSRKRPQVAERALPQRVHLLFIALRIVRLDREWLHSPCDPPTDLDSL